MVGDVVLNVCWIRRRLGNDTGEAPAAEEDVVGPSAASVGFSQDVSARAVPVVCATGFLDPARVCTCASRRKCVVVGICRSTPRVVISPRWLVALKCLVFELLLGRRKVLPLRATTLREKTNTDDP